MSNTTLDPCVIEVVSILKPVFGNLPAKDVANVLAFLQLVLSFGLTVLVGYLQRHRFHWRTPATPPTAENASPPTSPAPPNTPLYASYGSNDSTPPTVLSALSPRRKDLIN